MPGSLLPARRLFRLALSPALIGAALVCPWRVGIVSGRSMEPTLRPGSLFLYHRAAPPRPGAVVVVRMEEQLNVKRVYALGPTSFWALRFDNGAVMPIAPASRSRYGQLSRWCRRHSRSLARLVRVRVPRDYAFVVGDGQNSLDSRQLGPVPVTEIQGQVLAPARAGWKAAIDLCAPPPPRRVATHSG